MATFDPTTAHAAGERGRLRVPPVGPVTVAIRAVHEEHRLRSSYPSDAAQNDGVRTDRVPFGPPKGVSPTDTLFASDLGELRRLRAQIEGRPVRKRSPAFNR